MTDHPRFSVVIPAYGRPESARRAVESVLAQTIADVECIVVDDASPEPIVLPADRRLRVLRRASNGGPAAARNSGLGEVRGTYVSFLDDDDLYPLDRLEIVEPHLETNPLVLTLQAGIDGRSRRDLSLNGWVADTILDAPVPHHAAATMRTTCALPFDESFPLAEDVDWWLRMAFEVPFMTIERVGLLHRLEGEDKLSRRYDRWTEGTMRLFEKHPEYFAAHPKARSVRWRRLGSEAMRAGRRAEARRAFTQSFKAQPSMRGLVHLFRAVAGRVAAYG